MAATLPSGKAKLRSCLLCSILLSSSEFRKSGCPNCEEILQMKGSGEKVAQCTSAQFDGVIAVMRDNSWVARWQRTDKYTRGLYAARVTGKLPEDVIEELNSRGFTYRRRDEMDEE
ncbi:transcription initiation protein spt4 [Mrakia frigida]|uniref:transcription elongation factor SPT4 n=1 Tax=Mrakia frigida TaxID=29902 RepID=UPI003FCC1404